MSLSAYKTRSHVFNMTVPWCVTIGKIAGSQRYQGTIVGVLSEAAEDSSEEKVDVRSEAAAYYLDLGTFSVLVILQVGEYLLPAPQGQSGHFLVGCHGQDWVCVYAEQLELEPSLAILKQTLCFQLWYIKKYISTAGSVFPSLCVNSEGLKHLFIYLLLDIEEHCLA